MELLEIPDSNLKGRGIEAARDARDCGEMDSTGTLCWDPEGGFCERTSNTSWWDCMVMRTDSAEVMQPLE
jgi:hypothetical protein